MRGSYGCVNRGQHRIKLLQNLVVPEAHHTIPAAFEERCPQRVVLDAVGMLAAVELNDQSTFKATEVDNIRADRKLTPELLTAESPIPQAMPEATFSVCEVSPQLAGNGNCIGRRPSFHPLTLTLSRRERESEGEAFSPRQHCLGRWSDVGTAPSHIPMTW